MISAVITAYNSEKYIKAAIDSILNQTLQADEIIVVNDGSVDRTDEIITSFLSDKRFVYIKQENKGQAKAKNVGSRQATGDLIAFLDSDDVWREDKLEKQVSLFDDPDTAVVYSNISFIDQIGMKCGVRSLVLHRGNVTEQLLFNNFVPFSSAVIRKSVMDDFSHQDEAIEIGTDWDLFLRISTEYRLDYVDDCLVNYRVGNKGKLSSNLDKRFFCADQVKRKFFIDYPQYRYLEKKKWAQGYLGRAFIYLANGHFKKADVYAWKGFRMYPAYCFKYIKYLIFRLRSLLTF